MFDLDVIYTLIPIVSFLWALGGSGWLPARKFGVPIAISIYALGYGITWWKFIIALIGISFFTWGPGYGDRYVRSLGILYWPYIFFLGFMYGFCQFGLSLHFGHWLVLVLFSGVCSVLFGGTMLLSKAKLLPWKWAEIITGGSVGLVGAMIIYG